MSMRRRAVRRSALALGVLAVLAIGYGAREGFLVLPGTEALRCSLEGAPPTRRLPAEFYALGWPDRLAQAWAYVDRGDGAWALRAAQEFRDGDGVPAGLVEEAEYLAAIVYARYLEKPWHAVAALRAYLDAHPAGAYAPQARLLLAEAYVEVGWVGRGVETLRDALREDLANPLATDAQALLQRLERRQDPATRGGAAERLRALVPNNLRSLALSFLGFAGLLIPSLFKIGLRFHDGTNPAPGQFLPSVTGAFRRAFHSRVYRLLFLCFVCALFLQYQLNRAAKAREEARIQEALRIVHAAFGR